MAITCEINLFKHPDNEYIPGGTIRGTIKYVLKEEAKFNKITVSLKGQGQLQVNQYIFISGIATSLRAYANKEKYIDIDHIVTENKKPAPTPAGSHEIQFSFKIPENIPPSFKLEDHVSGYRVYCKIAYYIRIKFERSGFLAMNKRFKKKINIANVVTPTLPTYPTTYLFDKKPFLQKENLRISGTVANSVATGDGKVMISYNLNNATILDIKEVKIRLFQEIVLNCNGYFPDPTDFVKISSFKTAPIKPGGTQAMDFIFNIPKSVETMQHSGLVARNYVITVEANLPLPNHNAIMRMPIEVLEDKSSANIEEHVMDDAPPSYSEVMNECKKGELD